MLHAPGLLLHLLLAPVGEQTRERRKKRGKRKVETDGSEPKPLTPRATATTAIATVRWHGQWK
jgi:hypothetical protein